MFPNSFFGNVLQPELPITEPRLGSSLDRKAVGLDGQEIGRRGCAAGKQLPRPLHSTRTDWVCTESCHGPRALAQPCTYRQEHGQMRVDRHTGQHWLGFHRCGPGSPQDLCVRRGEEGDGSVLLTLNWPRSIGVNYGSCLA